jgi:hypothetical protein
MRYSKLYDAVLNKSILVTFGQFLRLHELKVLDASKVKFVSSEFNQDSFGHFEIEQDTPSYDHKIFFGSNYLY